MTAAPVNISSGALVEYPEREALEHLWEGTHCDVLEFGRAARILTNFLHNMLAAETQRSPGTDRR
jgi:hypothetical protein